MDDTIRYWPGDLQLPGADPAGLAAAVLAEVAGGARALRAVRHPLGFVCLPVYREPEFGLCVHVFDGRGTWQETVGPTTSPVHSHSWDLTSHVLYGRVGNLRMRVFEEPSEPTHRIYEVHSRLDGVDEIRPTPQLVRCVPGAEDTSALGDTYVLPTGEFHTTVLPSGGAAATLIEGRTRAGRLDRSLGPVHGVAHRVVRQQCDAAETVRIARAVLRRMDESRTAA